MTTGLSTLVGEVLDGKYDEVLDEVETAVRERHKLVRQRTAAQNRALLKRGDTVRFSDTISPQYLRGMTGTVVSKDKKRVLVQTPDDWSYRRFRNTKVRVPADLIEKEE